jgi:hypothetical protein
LSGFAIETERNYILADAPVHKVVLLGEVADAFVVDFDQSEEYKGARNYVEEMALSVGAPEGSLRNVSEVLNKVCVSRCEL